MCSVECIQFRIVTAVKRHWMMDTETALNQSFKVRFIELSVMTGSILCHKTKIPLHEEGGYVIINGNAKVIVPQEKYMHQTTNFTFSTKSNVWNVQIRSRNDETGIMSDFCITYSPSTAEFRVKHSLLLKNTQLPLGVLAAVFDLELPQKVFEVERDVCERLKNIRNKKPGSS